MKLSEKEQDALKQAQEYGDWFCIQSTCGAPVRAKHQTIKSLYRKGLLEHAERTKYNAMGWPSGSIGLYRAVEPNPIIWRGGVGMSAEQWEEYDKVKQAQIDKVVWPIAYVSVQPDNDSESES